MASVIDKWRYWEVDLQLTFTTSPVLSLKLKSPNRKNGTFSKGSLSNLSKVYLRASLLVWEYDDGHWNISYRYNLSQEQREREKERERENKSYRFHCFKVGCIVKKMNINQVKSGSWKAPSCSHETFSRPFTLHRDWFLVSIFPSVWFQVMNSNNGIYLGKEIFGKFILFFDWHIFYITSLNILPFNGNEGIAMKIPNLAVIDWMVNEVEVSKCLRVRRREW